MTHPVKHVSDLPGILLQVILPVHGVDDHQLILLVVSQIVIIKKTLISPNITTTYHVLGEQIQT